MSINRMGCGGYENAGVPYVPPIISPQLRIKPATAAITLGGTMRLTGTSPAVTLTGTLAFAAGLVPGIKVEITTGGAIGVGVFRVSYDSGATWAHSSVTLVSTYALDGAANGVTLNFAAGTYVLADNYEGTVASLTSSEGSGYTFVQATAGNQPVFRDAAVTPDGKDALFHVTGGAGQYLVSSDAAAAALFLGDPALTVFGRVAYTSADALGTWLSATTSASNDTKQRYFRQTNTSTGFEQHIAINDASTTISNVSTVTPLTGTTNAHTICWYFPGSNGGANLEVNGNSESLTIATCNIGTLTGINRVAIGTIADSAPSVGMGGYIYEIVCFGSALSPSDRAAWVAAMA